jgi:hypothetical protein
MNNTHYLIALLLMISGCGLNTERDGTIRVNSSEPKAFKTRLDGDNRDLIIRNAFFKNQEFHLLDPNSGARFALIGTTTNPLLTSTVKKGKTRTIGLMTLKYENIRFQEHYETKVKPEIFYTSQKYPINVTLIHDETMAQIWFGIPEINESILSTTTIPVQIDSGLIHYCSQASLKIKILGKMIKNHFDCTSEGRCFTDHGSGNLQKILEAGGHCTQNSTIYGKTEIKNNTIKPIEILIEVEKDDPSKLETIHIVL